ncbi:MAG: NUDIX domain-containing protein [Clostridia bacterium]|nr:NUDIX domain-containing protein [Clostridia bacterium]
MEIIDLYDNKKQKLNKTMAREDGEPAAGEFKLSVHAWVLNDEGKLLIQKRNENLKRNPGKWGFTGGAVDANETSLDGAMREIKEELGVEISKDEIEYLLSFKREKGFVDIWLVKKNIAIEELVLQPEEVSEARWVSLKELKMLIENDEMVKSVNLYLDIFEKLLKKCHNVSED